MELFAVVALLASANPARVWAVLPDGSKSERVQAAVIGAGAAGTVVVLVSVASRGLLNMLSIGDVAAAVSVGTVLIIWGVYEAIAGLPSAQPALAGPLAGLVPVAFPTMLSPPFVFAAVGASIAATPLTALTGVVIAVAACGSVSCLATGQDAGAARRVAGSASRALGLVQVVCGATYLVAALHLVTGWHLA